MMDSYLRYAAFKVLSALDTLIVRIKQEKEFSSYSV